MEVEDNSAVHLEEPPWLAWLHDYVVEWSLRCSLDDDVEALPLSLIEFREEVGDEQALDDAPDFRLVPQGADDVDLAHASVLVEGEVVAALRLHTAEDLLKRQREQIQQKQEKSE